MASFGPTPAIVSAAVAEEAAAQPPAAKKPRKAKAPKVAVAAAPVVEKKKRARTAFLFYSNANRATVRELQPGIKITEAAVILGAQWKALSDADKAPYLKLAAEDKARIESENAKPVEAPAVVVVAPAVVVPVVEAPLAIAAAEVAEPVKGKKRTVKK